MRSIILSVAAVCLASGASGEGLKIKPGMWSNETSVSASVDMKGESIPVPDRTETREECITAEDATLDPDDLAEEGCEVSEIINSAGKLSFALTCSQNGMIMAGGMNMSRNGDGTSTSGNFNLTSNYRGVVTKVNGTIKGTRTGDC